MSKEQYAISILFSPIFIFAFSFIIVVIVKSIRDYFYFKKKKKIIEEKFKKEWEEYLEIPKKIDAIKKIIDNFSEKKTMLKIKDNVDLKELEKYGFTYDEDWYYDFVPYNENDYIVCSYICVICSIKRCYRILRFDHIQPEDFEKACCILYDLIQAGLVEKVEVTNNE